MHETPYCSIRDGDRDAFTALVREYGGPLKAFACHILGDMTLAEDCVQDLFATVWLHRRKLDFGAALRDYLYTAVRNMAFNQIRTRERLDRRHHEFRAMEEQASAFMVEQGVYDMLSRAVDMLPGRTAEVIRLSLDGLKQEEIARQMGVTVQNVKNLKTIGIKRLREILGAFSVLLLNM